MFPDPKYAKIRAALQWTFESLMVCMLACGAMMLVIQAVNQFVPGIVIPDRRKPVAYTLIIIFVLLFRSYRLINHCWGHWDGKWSSDCVYRSWLG